MLIALTKIEDADKTQERMRTAVINRKNEPEFIKNIHFYGICEDDKRIKSITRIADKIYECFSHNFIISILMLRNKIKLL